MSSIAIIMGCWENYHQQPEYFDVVDNIIEFIDNSTDIAAVLLSGQHTPINSHNEGSNKWYSNAKEEFYDQQGVDWIRRNWKTKPTTYIESVDNKILNHPWNKCCMTISEQWELEYLINTRFNWVDSIYYLGVGWNFGVMRDYIGWGQLCNSIQYRQCRPVNILTKQSCVLENNNGTLNYPLLDWDLVGSDIYQKPNLEWNHNG